MSDLPIERIVARVLEAPLEDHVPMSFSQLSARRTFLVEVHAGGEVGIGESWINYPDWAATERLATLLEGVAPLALGCDALDPGALLDSLVAALGGVGRQWGAHGPIWQAISGIDIALWDLHGRLAGTSTAQTLGLVRDSAPAYASGVGPTKVHELTERALELGLTAVKTKVGFGQETDRATIAAVRETAPDIRIFADANQAWTLEEAIANTTWLQQEGVELLEEPVSGDDPRDLATLHEVTGIPLAGGENVYGLENLVRLVTTEGLVHAQPDVAKSGGLTVPLRLAEQLDGTGCVLSPHWYSGAIGLRASITLATTVTHAGWIELDVRANPLRDDLVTDGFPLREGHVLAPGAHGLVGDLDADAVSRFQVHSDERSLS
ncbi:mandelate racemase/muconate lactonizing enzyme family protein [Brachybacterium sacelli]|uniref:L-alanine-DL-glutamate epimerase-like enolase superfamily enzyme n=1 Tax=Brachybacterium sacelli TaxID=173364 RepID=A0ABS4WZ62_9MICO|nr:mandelate racemase/muconate lactonizing enzyme family protein [Brachybacterium sacelli]MBP2381501.1 L-alanine-DL-glutamate epimerase-like enolase superfamily enzyme [Brachybacterium sacelli]